MFIFGKLTYICLFQKIRYFFPTTNFFYKICIPDSLFSDSMIYMNYYQFKRYTFAILLHVT